MSSVSGALLSDGGGRCCFSYQAWRKAPLHLQMAVRSNGDLVVVRPVGCANNPPNSRATSILLVMPCAGCRLIVNLSMPPATHWRSHPPCATPVPGDAAWMLRFTAMMGRPSSIGRECTRPINWMQREVSPSIAQGLTVATRRLANPGALGVEIDARKSFGKLLSD